jgi:hypothetical protein
MHHLQFTPNPQILLPSLKSRVFRNDGPRNCKERKSTALARKLCFGTDVEKGKVARHKMVRDAGGFVEDVDLTRKHVFGFFVCVGGNVARGAWLDAVEAGG